MSKPFGFWNQKSWWLLQERFHIFLIILNLVPKFPKRALSINNSGWPLEQGCGDICLMAKPLGHSHHPWLPCRYNQKEGGKFISLWNSWERNQIWWHFLWLFHLSFYSIRLIEHKIEYHSNIGQHWWKKSKTPFFRRISPKGLSLLWLRRGCGDKRPGPGSEVTTGKAQHPRLSLLLRVRLSPSLAQPPVLLPSRASWGCWRAMNWWMGLGGQCEACLAPSLPSAGHWTFAVSKKGSSGSSPAVPVW